MTRTPLSMLLTASMLLILPASLTDGTTLAAGRQVRSPQTFRAATELVRIDVLATLNGRPLKDLTAEDFEVLDNGVAQRPQIVTTAGSVKVMLLLDVSGSIAWGAKMQRLVSASQALIGGLGADDEASLLTFADRYSVQATAVRGREVIEERLMAASAQPMGRTALWDALFVGLSLLAGEGGRSLVLVFSDGLDTASWCDGQKAREVIGHAEAVVYAVTVPALPALGPEEAEARPEEQRGWLQAINRSRESFVPKDLKDVVERSGGELFPAEQGDGLANTFLAVLDQFRARYLLTYEPTGVRRDDGWHELRVRLKGRAGTIRARSGYYATSGGAGR